MAEGYFFVGDEADLAVAGAMAQRGYLVVPMTSALEARLAGTDIPSSSVADVEIRTAVKDAEAEAETMAGEMVAAIENGAPELLDYEGLDLRPAVFHGAYHYLASEIAFARQVASCVAPRAGEDTEVVVGGRGLLADLVVGTLAGLGVEAKVPPGGRGRVISSGPMRTIARDVPLLVKSKPDARPSERPRIALVATSRTQPRLCVDVLKALTADAEIELYGSNFDVKAPGGLDVAHIGRLDYHSARSVASLRRRARHYRSLIRRVPAIRAGLEEERWRWTDPLIDTRLPAIIDRVTFYAEQCLSFARTAPPSLVMMMDEKSLIARLLPRACAMAGVPTLDMQHGVLASEPSLRGVAYSKLCVFGDSTKDALIEHGVDEATIEVTGCPRFDALAATRPTPRAEVVHRLGLDIGRAVIMVATQPVKYTITPKVKQDFLEALVEAAASVGFQLLIKKHPHEKDDIVERAVEGLADVLVTRKGRLADMLSASDALVTVHSTVALEALILDRPVVAYRPDGMPELVPFCSREAADVARDGAELAERIRFLLGEGRDTGREKRARFLERHLLLDGKSTKRIHDLALRLLGGSSGD